MRCLNGAHGAQLRPGMPTLASPTGSWGATRRSLPTWCSIPQLLRPPGLKTSTGVVGPILVQAVSACLLVSQFGMGRSSAPSTSALAWPDRAG